MGGIVQERRRPRPVSASSANTTTQAVHRSPTLRVAIIQVTVLIAAAVAIVLAVIAAPGQADADHRGARLTQPVYPGAAHGAV